MPIVTGGILTTPAPDDPADAHVQQMQTFAESVVSYRTAGAIFSRTRNTAAGGGVSATPVNLAPPWTIPASPFGVDVPYLVIVSAVGRCDVPAGAGYGLQARMDGVIQQEVEGGNGGSSAAYIDRSVTGMVLVTTPNATHTASATITGSTTVTVLNDKIMYVNILIQPVTAA